MNELTPEYLAEMWYIAQRAEFGVRWPIQPDDAHNIMTRLYDKRTELKDPLLGDLSIYCPMAGDYIYIYKKAEATLE